MSARGRRAESGVVLVIVLVALAILAALVAVAVNLTRSGLRAAQGEDGLFRADLLAPQILAIVATGLEGAPPLPRDGAPTVVTIGTDRVVLRVQAASGLVNPNTARPPLLTAWFGLAGLGAAESAPLVARIMARRADGARPFLERADVADLLADRPGLWPRLRAYTTVLGGAVALDPTSAPLRLQALSAAPNLGGVNLAAPGPVNGSDGFFELSFVRIDHPETVTRAQVLLDASGKLHLLSLNWPEVDVPPPPFGAAPGDGP